MGKCEYCGFKTFQSALQFHYLDKKDKLKNVTRFIDMGQAGKARAEAAKTILICSNCHIAIHQGELSELFLWKKSRSGKVKV